MTFIVSRHMYLSIYILKRYICIYVCMCAASTFDHYPYLTNSNGLISLRVLKRHDGWVLQRYRIGEVPPRV